MLSKAKTLQGYSLQNTDDETIGKVKEFYFDDGIGRFVIWSRTRETGLRAGRC